jgi:hypothetical protein
MYAMDEESSTGLPAKFNRDEWIANALKFHNDRDAADNAATRPPAGEEVRTLSATMADVFVGAQVDVLVKSLMSTDWSDPDENPAESIQRAIAERSPTWGNFRLLPIELRISPLHPTAGYCSLPNGVTEAYVSYVLVTPNLLLLTSTFVWDDYVSARLHDVLMADAESRFEVREDRIVQGSLEFVKRQAVAAVREDLRSTAFDWVENNFGAGAMATTKLLQNPFCVLVSVKSEITLRHGDNFMRILDVNLASVAFQTHLGPSVYFIYPHTYNASSAMWAFIKEDDSRLENGSKSGNIPYHFHSLVVPLTMVEAIRLYLVALSIRIEQAGDSLDELSLEHGQDAQIPKLRAIQLDLAVSLTRFCDGVDELVTRHFLLWNEYPKLKEVDGSLTPDYVPNPANQKVELSKLAEQIRNQEKSLRDLVSITSAAIVDRDMLRFTKDLRTLTKLLAGLTCLGIVISVVALVISAQH